MESGKNWLTKEILFWHHNNVNLGYNQLKKGKWGYFWTKKIRSLLSAHDHSPYGGLNLWLSHEHEINQMLFGKVLKKGP